MQFIDFKKSLAGAEKMAGTAAVLLGGTGIAGGAVSAWGYKKTA